MLESIFLSGGYNLRISRQVFSTKVFKLNCFSGMVNLYVVGKPSYDMDCRKNGALGINWKYYGPKGSIFDYVVTPMIWYPILLYNLKE